MNGFSLRVHILLIAGGLRWVGDSPRRRYETQTAHQSAPADYPRNLGRGARQLRVSRGIGRELLAEPACGEAGELRCKAPRVIAAPASRNGGDTALAADFHDAAAWDDAATNHARG